MSHHKTAFLVCLISVFAFSSELFAGGLYLNEFGTPSMGNAGAGASAEASDASTALHNPAGMTRLDRPQLMLAAGLGYSETRFDSDGGAGITGDDGGNAGGWIPILGTHYVHPINEDWRFGFSVVSLAGAALDYNNDWTGRYQNQEVTLMTVTAIPTLAYKVNDWLSVAAGPTIGYGTLDMDVAVDRPGLLSDGKANIDGDDVDYGYTVSALVELSERTRFGIFYISEMEVDLDGDVKLDPSGLSVGVDTTIPFAQLVRGSLYHDLNEKWSVVGTVGWDDWSTMDNVTISGTNAGADLPRNWSDTWHYSAGVHYRPNEKWLLRTGFAYDTNPVDATDRTADMPIDRQMRYAFGASYKWTETLTVGGSFVYADYGSGSIKGSTLSGDYKKSDIYFLGLHANWIY
ncbi:MAG: OmpP1/FadL family transporter [Planctomycetota bacterium]